MSFFSIPFQYHQSVTAYSNCTDLYYVSFPSDRYKVKGLAASIMFLEIVQTAIILRIAYEIFASDWGGLLDTFDWFESAIGTLAITGCLREFYPFCVH